MTAAGNPAAHAGGRRPVGAGEGRGPAAAARAVLAAFGVAAEPVRLAGGRGGTWRAGDVVLKPVDFRAETVWRAEVLDRLPDGPRFRGARWSHLPEWRQMPIRAQIYRIVTDDQRARLVEGPLTAACRPAVSVVLAG